MQEGLEAEMPKPWCTYMGFSFIFTFKCSPGICTSHWILNKIMMLKFLFHSLWDLWPFSSVPVSSGADAHTRSGNGYCKHSFSWVDLQPKQSRDPTVPVKCWWMVSKLRSSAYIIARCHGDQMPSILPNTSKQGSSHTQVWQITDGAVCAHLWSSLAFLWYSVSSLGCQQRGYIWILTLRLPVVWVCLSRLSIKYRDLLYTNSSDQATCFSRFKYGHS